MAERKSAFSNYRVDLTGQMGNNEANRTKAKHEMIIEGKKTRLMIDQERNRIDMIKAQKLSGVQSLGVQDRYTAELLKKKASF